MNRSPIRYDFCASERAIQYSANRAYSVTTCTPRAPILQQLTVKTLYDSHFLWDRDGLHGRLKKRGEKKPKIFSLLPFSPTHPIRRLPRSDRFRWVAVLWRKGVQNPWHQLYGESVIHFFDVWVTDQPRFVEMAWYYQVLFLLQFYGKRRSLLKAV